MSNAVEKWPRNHVHNPSKHMADLLPAWLKKLELYEKEEMQDGLLEDAAYWYGEAGVVSVLAGAAWTKGWFCIQDYRTTGKSKGKVSTRWVDLYAGKGNYTFILEAKQQWGGKFDPSRVD